MKRLFIAIAIAATALVAIQVDKAHAITAPPLAQERVEALPEDCQKFDTIIITSDAWKTNPAELALVSWFQSNPRLKALADQTKVHHYQASSWEYNARFRGAVGDKFPAVIVQQATGKKVYKDSGANLPRTANDLANAISKQLKRVQPASQPQIANQLAVAHAPSDASLVEAGKIRPIFKPRPNPGPCPGPGPCPAPNAPPAVVPPAAPPTPMIPDDSAHTQPVDEGEEAAEPKDEVSQGTVIAIFGAIGAAIVGVTLLKHTI